MILLRINSMILGVILATSSVQVLAYSSPLPLPKGVRAMAYVYGFAAGVDGRLTSDGELQQLAHPLNRSVTLDEIAESEPDLLRLKSVLGDLDPQWANELLNVNLYSDISVFESRRVTGFMYGITDRFAMGFMIPWINREVDFSFRADVVNNAGPIASAVGDIPALQNGLAQLRDYPLDTQTFNKAIFTDRGYDTPTSQQMGAWGDLEIEGRYTYALSDNYGLGVRTRIQAPTSTYRPDIKNVLDQDLAEKTWAFKAYHLSEVALFPRVLSWSTMVGGAVRLPKEQRRAYARSADEPLPDLTDSYQIETVEKTIGPEFNADTGLQLTLFNGWVNLMSSYYYARKGEDRIVGNRGLDYARETEGTGADSHGYELSAEFSTFAPFQRGTFFIPMKLSAAYVRPVAGHNTIFAPYWRFDSVILF
jgi:hypothetical protein